MLLQIKKAWKQVAAIIAVGIAVAVLMKNRNGTAADVFITDLFFTIGTLFFFLGLLHLIGNMGMFTSLKYGARSLYRIVTNRKVLPGEMQDGYIEYAKSRPKHKDVPMMMLFTAGFFALSILSLFIVG